MISKSTIHYLNSSSNHSPSYFIEPSAIIILPFPSLKLFLYIPINIKQELPSYLLPLEYDISPLPSNLLLKKSPLYYLSLNFNIP